MSQLGGGSKMPVNAGTWTLKLPTMASNENIEESMLVFVVEPEG